MSKGKGRIITGPGGDEPQEEREDIGSIIPALNRYWVKWVNEEGVAETVNLSAHIVDIYDDGMLVFKAFARNENAALLAAGAPPVFGYYVRSFRNHSSFGQEIPIDATAAPATVN